MIQNDAILLSTSWVWGKHTKRCGKPMKTHGLLFGRLSTWVFHIKVNLQDCKQVLDPPQLRSIVMNTGKKQMNML